MYEVRDRIIQRMKELNLRQVDLINLTGLSKGTISKWISGTNIPSNTALPLLATALETTSDWIMKGKSIDSERNNKKDEKSNVIFSHKKLKRIPIIDFVQAGAWREVVYDGINPIDYTYTDYEGMNPADIFSVLVDGLSMTPRFMPNDELIIDPNLAPQPGNFVIAQNGEYEVTFKKYRVTGYDEEGRELFELVPLNTDFAPLDSKKHHIRIIGVVVKHIQNLH
ncbi:LexA family protein [Acinetobacter sp. MB5]|uniref:LexA family protein n=1 Tax=Acinetobacter sp. MB5 TaxID=2069438 RepID=UPI000DD07245|nr:S24 family peptidase [Acinetobacter sp. MB5]